MVLHSCSCVYVCFDSNVAAFMADRFASSYVLLCKIENR